MEPGEVINGNITRRMRFACCIKKATNTHSEYVILIDFPRQKWLRERASLLMFIRALPVLLVLRQTLRNFAWPQTVSERVLK